MKNQRCFKNESHKHSYWVIVKYSCRINIVSCLYNLSVHGFVVQGDNKALVRLKRYIALCGVWRNYKKLLNGCRSVRSQVAVLKKELEDLGVHG